MRREELYLTDIVEAADAIRPTTAMDNKEVSHASQRAS
jgi:hypothetical protein